MDAAHYGCYRVVTINPDVAATAWLDGVLELLLQPRPSSRALSARAVAVPLHGYFGLAVAAQTRTGPVRSSFVTEIAKNASSD